MGRHLVRTVVSFTLLVPFTEAHADCIDEPTAACLVELALAEVDKAHGTHDFDLNGDRILSQLASIQAATGDIAGAARTGSRIGAGEPKLDVRGEPMLDIAAQQLLFFVEEGLIKHRPNSADLTPIQFAAQAFLETARASKLSKRTVGAEGRAVAILALIGSVDVARSALDDVVHRFAEAVEAGDTDVLPAAVDLLGAAIALGDFAKAREIVGLTSQEGMDERGISPQKNWWTNKKARGDLGRALAEAGNIAGAEEIAESLDGGIRNSILNAIAIARIRSGDLAETIERIRGMPAGNSLAPIASRDPSIWLLTETLKESGQLAAAAALADEMIDHGGRDNVKIGIALAFLAADDVPPAEALVAKITDTGRAKVIIKLAMIQARQGDTQEARRLLGEATEALAAEQNPARQVDFNVGIAMVFLELNDREGAETAVDAAFQSLEGIGDPMLQFQEATFLAAVQTKLGHEDEAVATLATVLGGKPDDLALGRILSARFLANEEYFADARVVLSRTLRDVLSGESIDPLVLAELYGQAAEALITESRGN